MFGCCLSCFIYVGLGGSLVKLKVNFFVSVFVFVILFGSILSDCSLFVMKVLILELSYLLYVVFGGFVFFGVI